MTDVRTLPGSEWGSAADTAADAFSEDPLMTWLLGGTPERLKGRLSDLFGSMLEAPTYRDNAEVHVTADGSGGAIWLRPPGHFRQPILEQLRLLPRMLSVAGRRTPRFFSTMAAVEKQHPAEHDHWYLMALAVRRGSQGRGIGSSLLDYGLRRVDAAGMPAYLESSNPRNISLYERHGFRVTRRLDIGVSAPVVTAMWREPRPH
jgi:ribosomal protein S18 acetylase RimI-like enzyme